MTEERDPRLELPGATTPPVEGRRWLWVKLGVWVLALLLMVGAAWSVAWVLSTVRVRIDLPKTSDASRSEVVKPPVAPSEPSPSLAMSDGGRSVTNPVWLQAPRPEYPKAAQRADEESGMARLECQTRTDGRVQACRILEETPTGVGFGEEAVRATMKARVQPELADGALIESRIAFTIRYRLD